MIIALFVTAAAVVSMPILAVVVVSIASRSEDAAWSLGAPAQGVVQAAARQLLDFHTEEPAWPLPKSYDQARPPAPAPAPAAAPAPALRAVGNPSVDQGSAARLARSAVTGTHRPAAPSKISVRTAA